MGCRHDFLVLSIISLWAGYLPARKNISLMEEKKKEGEKEARMGLSTKIYELFLGQTHKTISISENNSRRYLQAIRECISNHLKALLLEQTYLGPCCEHNFWLFA